MRRIHWSLSIYYSYQSYPHIRSQKNQFPTTTRYLDLSRDLCSKLLDHHSYSELRWGHSRNFLDSFIFSDSVFDSLDFIQDMGKGRVKRLATRELFYYVECKAVLKGRDSMEMHVKFLHRTKDQICSYYDNGFSLAIDLIEHCATNCPPLVVERETKFKCYGCDKMHISDAHLTKHQLGTQCKP